MGVLTDMSGALSDYTGQGSVTAARLAAADFLRENGTFDIDVVSADTQNKPDIAATIARTWFDQDAVDVIVDVPGSAIVLALSQIAKDKDKVLLSTSSSSSRITGADCTPNTINWTFSTWSLAHGTATAVVRHGGDTWFFIAQDWEYGKSIQEETSKVIVASGGRVLGSVRHPIGVSDFSSYLLQAQASQAKIIGLAGAGSDTINAIKQASEFGITAGKQRLSTLFLAITDVDSLGLAAAQGLTFTTAWYWDLNDGTRAFADRFLQAANGRRPSANQAAVYSSVLAYLRAAAASKDAKDGKAVVARIREAGWFNDPLFGRTRLREDGTVEHVMYLAEVKRPDESKGRWDYYRILDVIPAEDAFQPMRDTGCPLASK